MSSYDTNLAAEYYVLSCLHRIRAAAALTLGNKKGVDIMVARSAGDSVTVEVKGVAGRHDWRAGKIQSPHPHRHFVVLVTFQGLIRDAAMPRPRVWVIPFPKLVPFMRAYKGSTNISRAAVIREGTRFENAWHYIEKALGSTL